MTKEERHALAARLRLGETAKAGSPFHWGEDGTILYCLDVRLGGFAPYVPGLPLGRPGAIILPDGTLSHSNEDILPWLEAD